MSALALRCAASLGPDPAQCAEIEHLGLAYLRAASEPARWQVVQALAALPPEHSQLDLRSAAIHPVAAVRALAAVRWAANPSALPVNLATDLARDPDHRVRRNLARALAASGTDPTRADGILNIMSQDVRRSVRSLVRSPAVPATPGARQPGVSSGSPPEAPTGIRRIAPSRCRRTRARSRRSLGWGEPRPPTMTSGCWMFLTLIRARLRVPGCRRRSVVWRSRLPAVPQAGIRQRAPGGRRGHGR